MRAAGFRPATPALAKMLEIGTDHACDAVGQHTPVGLPAPQSLLLSSTIDATGRCSQDLPGRHQASNRHRARCGRVLSLPRLRALQVCRRRPTLGVAAVPHGRHPQTFTEAELMHRSKDTSGCSVMFGLVQTDRCFFIWIGWPARNESTDI